MIIKVCRKPRQVKKGGKEENRRKEKVIKNKQSSE